ncbi:MAG: PspC domain-containing protein [Candidatus Paceibacterota bacterium]|jgi:phage shock protein C
MEKLYRSEKDKIICGVCGGLAEYFKIDSVVVRIFFILLLFSNGVGFFIYIISALLIPKKFEKKEKVEEVDDIEKKEDKGNFKIFLGIVLFLIGLNIMISSIFNFDIFDFIDWKIILSLFLLLIGLKLIFDNRKR